MSNWPMEFESEEEVSQARESQARIAERLAASQAAGRDLERVAEFLAAIGFGTDWGVDRPAVVPRCLRHQLARAFVRQGAAESYDDALVLLDAELPWEST